MFSLRDLKVGTRLAAGFGVLLVLMLAMLAIVQYGNRQTSAQFSQVADINMEKIELLNSMLNTNNAVLLQRRLMLIKRGADLDADFAIAAKLFEKYDADWAKFHTYPRNAQGDVHVQNILNARAAADAVTVKLDAAMAAYEFDRAVEILLTELKPVAVAWNARIADYIAYQNELSGKSRQMYREVEAQTRNLILVMSLLSLLLGAALAWSITRSLTKPLSAATAAMSRLAQGNLDIELPTDGKDEVGQVLLAIGGTRDNLAVLIEAIHEMGQRHDAGELSFRMDASQLQGQYRAIVELINAQMEEHVAAALGAGRMAALYARGDLSQDFPRKPGDKAELTNAMDSVKSTIQRINQQILQMSQAAVHGDFSVRGDESQFEFGFRDMVTNLNQLMATADGSLGSLSTVLKGIADGDLTVRMEGDYQGVFATMRDDANATVLQLRKIVGGIQSAAASINDAASEIATGNNELSRRTEQQAANLEETAASMEELTSTVRQNAEHARQANQLAINAQTVATEGGQAAGAVANTMSAIEQSSRRIADIISVIDGIAFQTNILALNAAVEAARAGEQGRGFAVVASEVRSLAQRSAGAAKEIKDLIDDSVGKVAIGSEQVRKAGTTMEQIVASVQRVTDIMGEISAASQEQTAGIEQVSQTVMQMDEATQQNAALVEEASAATRAMEEQAAQLARSVSVFRLDGGHAAAMAPHADKHDRAATSADQPQRLHTPVTTVEARAMSATKGKETTTKASKPTSRRRPALAVAVSNDSEWQEF